MSKVSKTPISVFIAIASGLVFLSTYFLELSTVREYILSWVTILAAAALILGVLNLFTVHVKKVKKSKNTINSIALLISLSITFIITLIFGTQSTVTSWVFDNIILPAETSLLALLSITLTYAALRLVSRRKTFFTMIFMFFFLITLASLVPIFGKEYPFLHSIFGPWVTQVLASAGARGILIGVALGTITTGLRILFGADHPYIE